VVLFGEYTQYYSGLIFGLEEEQSHVNLHALRFNPGAAVSRRNSSLLVAVVLLLLPCWCHAASNSVLIVNGSSATTESSTTSNTTATLSADITAAGGVVTVADTIPASLAGYAQVWDIRFSSTSPLGAADIAQYIAYMQGGGNLFVMGETNSFATRNTSVLALINAAGGGNLTYVIPLQTQTVVSPVTLPNPVTSITYIFSGGVAGSPQPGTGTFASVDTGNNGTAVLWPKTTLSSAPAGTLAVVFDVTFMESSADTNSQNFLKNLIGTFRSTTPQINTTTAQAAPALSEWGLIMLGLLLVILAARALRIQPAQR